MSFGRKCDHCGLERTQHGPVEHPLYGVTLEHLCCPDGESHFIPRWRENDHVYNMCMGCGKTVDLHPIGTWTEDEIMMSGQIVYNIKYCGRCEKKYGLKSPIPQAS